MISISTIEFRYYTAIVMLMNLGKHLVIKGQDSCD